ncbi:SagB-type dehydrogenase family enzyme [Marinilabilia salmonicolor]|uniref:SagB-type dehydrogenase family enzyme n=2 Tax=Marinilabilia salmonicolor TaxID=989 RepID=A0A368UJ35_9BACT|nr:SagB-type dehydrogenase family enzyme [Marinilabilia salmonicolor]
MLHFNLERTMKTRAIKNPKTLISHIEGSLQNPENIGNLCALLYHENSKQSRFSLFKQGEEIGKFSNPYILERAAQPYKCFPTTKFFSMQEYKGMNKHTKDIFNVIKSRRSGRDYEKYSISLNELYQILYYSYGINNEIPIKGGEGVWSYRTVPSGGALYPLELYLYLNYSALPKGIYHYRPDKNNIELINENDHLPELRKIIFAEPMVNLPNCSCIIFISSVFQRTLMKYGERGYRFILQEVGFVSQNLSLICEAIGLSSCIIGSFFDDNINNLIKADGILESIQSVIVIGKKSENETES